MANTENTRAPAGAEAQQDAPADEWERAQVICDLPAVDEAIRNLLEDNTGDNATCLVREVMRALSGVAAPAGASLIAAAHRLCDRLDKEISVADEVAQLRAALSGAPAVAAEPLTEDRLPERLPVARIIELLEQAHIVTGENQYRNGRHFYRSLGHTTNVCEHDLIAFARGVESAAHGIGSPSANHQGERR